MIWIPEINDWIAYPDPNSGEIKLGKISKRFKLRDGSISIAVDGYRIALEDCAPPSFEIATIAYETLLERCALVGELADRLQAG